MTSVAVVIESRLLAQALSRQRSGIFHTHLLQFRFPVQILNNFRYFFLKKDPD